MSVETTLTPPEPPTVAVDARTFYGYFLRLGATGFGGPIALAGFMQRDLVDERRWISRQDYLDGLALAQLAPGPLAAQLAMYLGYVHSGVLGATVVSACFILPSFLMVWAISAAYVQFGGLPGMQALFYGIGAAVIGIIARSGFKLTRLTLKRRPLLWAIFLALAIATAWTEREIVWLFLAAGVVTVVPVLARTRTAAGRRRLWLGSGLETHARRIFVNVPNAKVLAVVDRSTISVSASWPVSAARNNYPLAFDEDGHRLFIGCRQPASMLLYDSTTGKQVGSFGIVGDTDHVFFDAQRQRVYMSGGERAVDVFDARAVQGYPRVARIPTFAGARTSLFIPAMDTLVVAAPKREGHSAQLLVFRAH